MILNSWKLLLQKFLIFEVKELLHLLSQRGFEGLKKGTLEDCLLIEGYRIGENWGWLLLSLSRLLLLDLARFLRRH